MGMHDKPFLTEKPRTHIMYHYILVDTCLGTTTAGKAGAALLREWCTTTVLLEQTMGKSFPPITTATSKILVLWAKGA
jgi:hypothetical protein